MQNHTPEGPVKSERDFEMPLSQNLTSKLPNSELQN